MQLRNYQADCLRLSLEHYRAGINRQLAVLATGLGKTAIASNLRSHHGFGKRVMFLVHLETLAVQAATALQKWNPHLRVAVEMAGSYADMEGIFPPDLIVASVPTLGRKGSDRIKRFDPFEFDCVIQDECFPAGTMIGARAIEDIRIGDLVNSVDVTTGKFELRKVISLSRRVATSLVTLHLSNGQALTCTPNHPFWTSEQKWVAAKDLAHYTIGKEYYVHSSMRSVRNGVSETVLAQNNDPDVLGRMQAGTAEDSPEGGHSSVRRMREAGRASRKDSLHGNEGQGLLLPRTQKNCVPEDSCGERAQAQHKDIIGAHENEQPDEKSGVSSEDGCDSQINESPSAAGRQRETNAYPAEDDFGSPRMADGSCDPDGSRVSEMLQGGRWERFPEGSDRDRRRFSFFPDSPRTGPEEGWLLESVRVDRVEVLEPTSPEFDGPMLGTCEVYNFGVEGNHNYFADGFLVHNCHIGVSDSFKRVYDHFGLLQPNPDGLLFLGITATPNRADGKGLRELFDVIVFDMGIQKGIADGWLCDLVGYRVDGKAHLDKVKTRAGDFAQDELSDEVNTPERNAIIVKEWYKVAYGKRTLAFTVDIQHALDLAEAFKAHSVPSEAVWGDDPDRHEKIRKHKSGEIEVLCNCNVLGIGYDDPQISCIISAAPTKSEVRYVQQVGRGTRICEGKSECIVLDIVDNSKKHSLTTISTLLGLPKDLDLKGEKYSVAKQKLERMATEFPTANVQDIKSLNELKSIAENVSLFQPNYPPEIARMSELAWRKSADGYLLAVGRDLVTISKDLREEYQIRGRVGDKVAEFSAQNLPGAMNVADRFVLDSGGVKGYLLRDARWKSDSPTDAQRWKCKQLKIEIPPNATKGAVSAAITAKMLQLRERA